MKKLLKIAALVVAVAIVVGVATFANALVGNPVSKLLVKQSAKQYIAKTYTEISLHLSNVTYNFKDGNYLVRVTSPDSIDTAFALYFDSFGGLKQDTYDNQVTGRFTTARRLDDAYREMTDYVFDSPTFPLNCDIAYGTIEFIPRQYADGEDVPSYALIQEELILDYDYDVATLAKKAGHLVVYISDDTVTIDRAAAHMLTLRQVMDESHLPFYAVDFVLQHPKPVDGKWSEERVDVLSFLYEDIYPEGLTERIEAAKIATDAYYAKQDQLKFADEVGK